MLWFQVTKSLFQKSGERLDLLLINKKEDNKCSDKYSIDISDKVSKKKKPEHEMFSRNTESCMCYFNCDTHTFLDSQVFTFLKFMFHINFSQWVHCELESSVVLLLYTHSTV